MNVQDSTYDEWRIKMSQLIVKLTNNNDYNQYWYFDLTELINKAISEANDVINRLPY